MSRSTALSPLLALLLIGCQDLSLYEGTISDTAGYGGDSYGESDVSDSDWDAADTGSADAPDEDDPTIDTGEPDTVDECEGAEALTLYLSPDDSNSMSSPVQARASILGGYSNIHDIPIRTWEFFNYYSFDYPEPDTDDTLGLTLELVAAPDDPDGFLLQIGVKSPTRTQRSPMNITLVLDTSGSMAGDAINRLRDASESIAASLQEGDVVSVVTWSADQTPLLSGHPVTGPNDPVLMDIIDALETGGGTDLSGGLTVGYGLAMDNYAADRINRVVLVSDGGANMGETDEELIGQHAGSQDVDGIYMVGVGVGSATSYNDLLMDNVTDAGKGASVFIPTAAEARRVFEDQFVSTMDVFARDVAVTLDLPAGFEIQRFSGEEYSTDKTEIEPQHLAPSDAMVFYQQLGHCDASTLTGSEEIGVTVRYKDAVTFEEHTLSTSASIRSLRSDNAAMLYKGAAIFAYADGLKGWQLGNREVISTMTAALERAEAANPGDDDLAEIREVVERLAE